jgi:hypothetical protein
VSRSIGLQPCCVRRCSSTIWPGRSGSTDVETSTHEPASFVPATSAASTIARTVTSAWLVVEARHDASARIVAPYRPVCGCVCTNVNDPSAAVVPVATSENAEEPAGCHCRVTFRPAMHPVSAAIEPETVTA